MDTKRHVLWFTVSVWLVSLTPGWGQADRDKVEEETSIDRSEMPEAAIELLSNWLAEARRIRFYRETGSDQVSYEVKLKRKRQQYSVEFYEDGSLMDVEQLISYRSLPRPVRDTLDTYLAQTYDRHRARRVQRQYSAEEGEAVLEALAEGNQQELTIRYELVVETQQNGQIGTYELLFDHEGSLLQERRIVRRALDNVLY